MGRVSGHDLGTTEGSVRNRQNLSVLAPGQLRLNVIITMLGSQGLKSTVRGFSRSAVGTGVQTMDALHFKTPDGEATTRVVGASPTTRVYGIICHDPLCGTSCFSVRPVGGEVRFGVKACVRHSRYQRRTLKASQFLSCRKFSSRTICCDCIPPEYVLCRDTLGDIHRHAPHHQHHRRVPTVS